MAGASLTAHASGYHFGTQSVSAQATANASPAEATDATTLFYNPAGMTRLQGTNFSGALNLVMPSVKYNNASASYPTQPYAAQPLPNGVTVPAGLNRAAAISGSTSGKLTKDLLAVPHMYLTHQLNDRVTVGVGIYVPFASETEYQRDSVLRYNVNQTSLTTIDINPTVAFKLNDQHSLAVGVIAQHAEASLREYANFGGSANPALNSLIPGVGGGHGNSDGYADVEGKDWGFGFNLGWMWEIDPTARVGVSYRSVIKHSLKGTADWTTPATLAGQAAASRGYIDSDVRVDIKTPESLSVHGFKQLDSKWAVMGDVTWTRHSRFDSLSINYSQPKSAPYSASNFAGQTADKTTLVPDWKDTWKVAVGATYQYSAPLQLRFGVAYDQSPVPDEQHRLSTMPDNDRIWLSFGGKYDLNKNSSINAAYSYIYIKNAKAQVNGYCGGSTAGAVNCVSSYTNGQADYKSYAHILGVQYNYQF
ncbi:OmpP1/FadL family transporter [Rivihabitans pingtungensis]|uniref:OmpP1/FadL family transporter n=1 Tax=Rivihabitans pingtungensis TaxID=1054498 RepID=UPI003A52240E